MYIRGHFYVGEKPAILRDHFYWGKLCHFKWGILCPPKQLPLQGKMEYTNDDDSDIQIGPSYDNSTGNNKEVMEVANIVITIIYTSL